MGRPFSFAVGTCSATNCFMKRQLIRLAMAMALVGVTIVAAAMWSGDYESSPDSGARFEIQAVRLVADRGYVWLEAHLKKSGDADHDLLKPVSLVTADGAEHEPADTTFAGTPETGFTDIWYKFWLEKKDLKGRLNLQINDGVLTIKSSEPIPVLKGGKEAVFKSSDWEKSWLGF